MKYIILTVTLLLSCSFLFSQEKARIGMSRSEVEKLFPGIKVSEQYENTVTLERPDTLYYLDENWGYRFENDSLNWIFFHKYINEINEKNFVKCLSATETLIADYIGFYGSPDTIINGNKKFKDPYSEHHWGYDVVEARWNDYNGMKIKVEFTFMGGKGEYSFLVVVNYFGKDYPYYE